MKARWTMLGLAVPLLTGSADGQVAAGTGSPKRATTSVVDPKRPLPPSTEEMRRTHKGPLSSRSLKPDLVRRTPPGAATPANVAPPGAR